MHATSIPILGLHFVCYFSLSFLAFFFGNRDFFLFRGRKQSVQFMEGGILPQLGINKFGAKSHLQIVQPSLQCIE